MNNLLMVLGAPNDPKGNLSQIAKDRLDCAFDFYRANSGFRIVCTGGFGAHFNTEEKPHHFYAKKYLVEKGISETVILNGPLSSNTMEDFQLSKDLVLAENPDTLVLITSDFHLERAKILYRKFINYPKILFIPAPSSLSAEALGPLIEHESHAVQRLNEQEQHATQL